MKSKKSGTKAKVNVKPLKVSKETVQNLSAHEATAVKGGGRSYVATTCTVTIGPT